MKKVLLAIMFLCAHLFASATDEQIINHFKSIIAVDGLDYKVENRQKVKEYPGYEYATVIISQPADIKQDNHHNVQEQRLNIIIKDNFIFPDVIDVVKNRSLREDFETQK